jgi:hypothetical protein
VARYRIGNKFLSQSEYDSEMDYRWGFILFIIGSIASGILIHFYIINPEWHKAIRFSAIVIPSIAIGVIFVLIRKIIAMLLFIGIALAVLAVIIKIVLSII